MYCFTLYNQYGGLLSQHNIDPYDIDDFLMGIRNVKKHNKNIIIKCRIKGDS